MAFEFLDDLLAGDRTTSSTTTTRPNFLGTKGDLRGLRDVARRGMDRPTVLSRPGFRNTLRAGEQALQFNMGEGRNVDSNPYFRRSINAAIRPVEQRLNEQILPGLRDEFGAAGQFGGSRHLFAGVAPAIRDDFSRVATDITSQMSSNEYNQAQQRALQSAGLLPGLADTRMALQNEKLNRADAVRKILMTPTSTKQKTEEVVEGNMLQGGLGLLLALSALQGGNQGGTTGNGLLDSILSLPTSILDKGGDWISDIFGLGSSASGAGSGAAGAVGAGTDLSGIDSIIPKLPKLPGAATGAGGAGAGAAGAASGSAPSGLTGGFSAANQAPANSLFSLGSLAGFAAPAIPAAIAFAGKRGERNARQKYWDGIHRQVESGPTQTYTLTENDLKIAKKRDNFPGKVGKTIKFTPVKVGGKTYNVRKDIGKVGGGFWQLVDGRFIGFQPDGGVTIRNKAPKIGNEESFKADEFQLKLDNSR